MILDLSDRCTVDYYGEGLVKLVYLRLDLISAGFLISFSNARPTQTRRVPGLCTDICLALALVGH